MKSKLVTLITCLIALSAAPHTTRAHCQIPCGIYNDSVRVTLMKEHITTLEKSMQEIRELQRTGTQSNQLIRWVNNKEKHADELAEIITAYFMTQRVKPAPEGEVAAFKTYQERITILHKMLIATMKTKQTTDVKYCTLLRAQIEEFEKVYPIKHEH